MSLLKRVMTNPNALSLRSRLVLQAAVILLYAAVFFMLYPLLPFGRSLTALAILPVALAAMLFGIGGGILNGLLLTLLNILLIYMIHSEDLPAWLIGHSPGEAVGLVTAGLLFGHIARLQTRLRRQIADQSAAESKLAETINSLRQSEEILQAREKELHESEALYKPLFENHHTVMLLIDPLTSRIVDANQAACDFYGYTRKELQGMAVGQINQLTEEPLRDALNVASSSEHSHFFFHHRLSSGEIRDVEVFTTRVQLSNRALLYSIIHDITENNRIFRNEREQRALAEALRNTASVLSSTLEGDEVLRRILDNIDQVVPHDGANILLINPEQAIDKIARSSSYGSETFMRQDTILGKSLFDIPGLKWMSEHRQPLIIPNTQEYPDWVSLPESKWVMSYIGAPMYARGELVGFLNLDSGTPGFFNESFTERLQAFVDQAAVAIVNARLYATVQQEALTDEVTRTYNRRGLAELGSREFDRALRFHRELSAVMLDIDNFKQVNDTYGHLTGDQVLRILADRCRANIREVDVLGRYGGEEFLIFLVENDLETAAQVAERLRLSVEQNPFETSSGRISITISLGVASLTTEIHDLLTLVERADQALYSAKSGGRNQRMVAE